MPTTRSRLWPVAAASGVVLTGQSVVQYFVVDDAPLIIATLTDEMIAMSVAGCCGAGAAFVGMGLERFQPAVLQNPAVEGILAISVLLSGIVGILTIVFGEFETVMLVGSALGLLGSGTLLATELRQLESAKARAVARSESAHNGKWGIGLVIGCLLNLIVSAVTFSNPGSEDFVGQLLGADLQLTSVIFSVPMLIGSAAGLMVGSALGDKEKYAYLGLSLTLVLSAVLFPPVAGLKAVSLPAALLCALFCSGMITNNLFNRDA
jgi:hypothetical protein